LAWIELNGGSYSIGRQSCFHCLGAGMCNCAACGSYAVGLVRIAGPCTPCNAALNRQREHANANRIAAVAGFRRDTVNHATRLQAAKSEPAQQSVRP
jgi:hypothetical protein